MPKLSTPRTFAFAIFMAVPAMNSLKKKKVEAAAAATLPNPEVLLAEIRDLLKKK